MNGRIVQAGLDAHKTFSRVTTRDPEARIVDRRRLDHRDRETMRDALRQLPPGTSVVLESTFGWGRTATSIAAAYETIRH